MKRVAKSNKLRKGFTIVELLIVIVIIGILAALVIVAYNGIQNRANETVVKSDIVQFRKRLEIIKNESLDGLYPLDLSSTYFNTAMGIKFTKGAYNLGRNNIYYAVSSDRTRYALGFVPKQEANAGFIFSSTTGVISSAPSVWGVDVGGVVGSAGGMAIYDYPGDGSGSGWVTWVN